MTNQTVSAIIIVILISTLFFIAGYNNKRIEQETERIDQLEIHHIIEQRNP